MGNSYRVRSDGLYGLRPPVFTGGYSQGTLTELGLRHISIPDSHPPNVRWGYSQATLRELELIKE
jgi:hypothetical protein